MASSVLGVPRALATTVKHLFRRPTTVQYPDELPPVSARHRGRHILHRYEDGLEKCVGCELCAWACPADSAKLTLTPALDVEKSSVSIPPASTSVILAVVASMAKRSLSVPVLIVMGAATLLPVT